ncbi:MAG: hypothetical protein QGI83_19500 [Candidatus Latescibacteria bacterium]|jgi:hypothetical protein|nr:hypothetical protein [Candidatus Latescibacterota bacterium]
MKAVLAPNHIQSRLHTEDTDGARLRRFVAVLERLGINPVFPSREALPDALSGADLLVAPTRDNPYETEELDILSGFVKSGGSFLHLSNHKPYPLEDSKLAAYFGYTFLSEMYWARQRPTLMRVPLLAPAVEALGLRCQPDLSFAVNNCCRVEPNDGSEATAIATLGPDAVDTETQEPAEGHIFAIAKPACPAHGAIVAVADSGIIGEPYQSYPGPGLSKGDNEEIIAALVRWLVDARRGS